MQVNIKIQRNQFIVSTEQQTKTLKSQKPFSFPRLLVGDFAAANQCLSQGVKDMGLVGLFKGKHDVRVEVNDYFGDGITPLERKIYQRLANCMKVNSFELELIRKSDNPEE